MNEKQINKLISIFESNRYIKLVYLFGSRINGKLGPLSDYDFGIFLDGLNTEQMYETKINLQYKISRLLKTDQVDIVILNLTESPELKYNIIAKSRLIYLVKPFKLLIEPRILNEYFDFRETLLKHNLTKVKT